MKTPTFDITKCELRKLLPKIRLKEQVSFHNRAFKNQTLSYFYAKNFMGRTFFTRKHCAHETITRKIKNTTIRKRPFLTFLSYILKLHQCRLPLNRHYMQDDTFRTVYPK